MAISNLPPAKAVPSDGANTDIGFAPRRLFIALAALAAVVWWAVEVNATLALPV